MSFAADSTARSWFASYIRRVPLVGQRRPLVAIAILGLLFIVTASLTAVVVADEWGRRIGIDTATTALNGSARGRLLSLSYIANGQLVGIWQDKQRLIRVAWDPVDLSVRSRAPQFVTSEAQFAPGDAALDVSPANLTASSDLRRIVWFANGALRWQRRSTVAPGAFDISPIWLNKTGLADGWQMKGLHLVGRSGLLVETTAGVVYMDLESPGTSMRLLEASDCAIAASGTRAVLVCPGTYVKLLDFATGQPQELARNSIDPLVGRAGIAVSPSDSFAVASQRATVTVWNLRSYGSQRYWETRDVDTPGVVRRIALGDGIILAAGDFDGIHLVRSDGTRTLLVRPAGNVPFLAALVPRSDFGTFAYANETPGIIIGSYRRTRGLGMLGWTAVGAFVSLWLALLLYVPLQRALREAERDGPAAASLAAAPPVGSSSPMPTPSPSVPDDLVRACAEGMCVAFVGAGVAAGAGLPVWRPLVEALLAEMSDRGLLDRSDSHWLRTALAEGQTDLVADGIVSKLPADNVALHEFLNRTFRPPAAAPTRVHRLLRDLALSAVVTTNLDDLLEKTFADREADTYTHLDGEALLAALTKREFFILKVYGSLTDRASVLLAPVQYYDAIARNVLFSRAMETLITSRTLLFIGSSLEGIEAHLNGMRFPTSMPQRHYALVATTGAAWRARADLLERRYGIQVLPFTASPGYPEVETFVGQLASAVARRTAAPATPGTDRIALQRVTLENIGPFDSLVLDLDRHWNILLGDNGVGKSTILKAIAVGMVGADAAPYAGRLIKAGATLGRIILETSAGRKYITEVRKGDRRAIVDSVPSVRLIDAERWLALGFPALRTFTWTAVKDLPTASPGRATSDDVMPLITGEVDPRMDTLKAWLVDLDYRDARARAEPAPRRSFFRRASPNQSEHANLRDEFFQVINEVTPGMDLKPVPIDPAQKEVLVLVNGAVRPIRIEGASQGTQSLLGWVGILLQRLNDFYGTPRDGDAPPSLLDQFALVLMDEIDAHMHPKWQQTIVSTLKRLFPHCQFVATTHSPLIVVGMERREVIVVRRPEGSGAVSAQPPEIERPMHALRGWSADQVLTDPLFGLETALDPRIHADVEEYTRLAAKDEPNPADEARLQELAGHLKIQRPAPKQRHEARLAFQMIEKALDAQLATIPAEKRDRVRAEAKVQIEENTTGSRRPG